MCLSPTERVSMEVECHMLPEGNRFDWYREPRTALGGEEEEEEQ